MASFLCLTIRFLQPYFHGRASTSEPEWPPSPLRVFQALVAAAATQRNERRHLQTEASSLRWLERQAPPLIIAPRAVRSNSIYRLYVPDNVGDKMARSWCMGGDRSVSDDRTEKDVMPVCLSGDAVHYLFAIAEELPAFDSFVTMARNITHLGWGVDLVIGNAEILTENQAGALSGVRWQAGEDSGTMLRVPIIGTLEALDRKHTAFLSRLSPSEFRPVPPLTSFGTVEYQRQTDVCSPPFAAFSILQPDASDIRHFDPVRQSTIVAAMVRHALAIAARDARWPQERINQVVHGHTANGTGPARTTLLQPRFSYVPLPSIEQHDAPKDPAQERSGDIRHVLVIGNRAMESDIKWAGRALWGSDLIDESSQQSTGVLTLIPITDRAVRRYVKPAAVWQTVLPVVLPGYDDPAHLRRQLCQPAGRIMGDRQQQILTRLHHRIDSLIRKALGHVGYSRELIEHAQIEWQSTGFLPGVEHTSRYAAFFPANLRRFSCYHLRITWHDSDGQQIAVPGPIVIGGGRHRGLGLCAPQSAISQS